jgi:predicted TIM-barrel fold metal-dependent hydrolase
MKKQTYIINAHAHCFTIDHVPNEFTKKLTVLSPLFTIRRIKKWKMVRWIIRQLDRKLIKAVLKVASPDLAKSLPRLVNFAEFFNVKSQKELVDELRSYYPANTKFVLLSMDMEYMGAGEPRMGLIHQLNELADLKRDPRYKDIIYPFVFADPRRDNVTAIVKKYLEDKTAPFQGIKIYPALGYYAFDKELKEVYLYALKHNIPITTHCIRGAVYYRGSMNDQAAYRKHPYTGKEFPMQKPADFTVNFTHPYNYECLLNKDILRQLWKEDDIDLSELKICLGHFGGDDEWLKYIEQSWLPDRDFNSEIPDCLDPKTNIWYDEENTETERGKKAYSWFSLVCELMRRYKNVYADISYTISEPKILPLLKILLESDKDDENGISSRILFGTDYYVVSKAGAEREMSLYLRGYLGEELFEKIAHHNPNKFLNLSSPAVADNVVINNAIVNNAIVNNPVLNNTIVNDVVGGR